MDKQIIKFVIGVWLVVCGVRAEEDFADDYKEIESRIDTFFAYEVKETRVRPYMDLLQSNGAFSDLDYTSIGESQGLRTHAGRIKLIVHYELRQPGATLSPATIASFSYITYNISKTTSKNWWLHLIGLPSSLWEMIYEARAHLSESVVKDYLDRYFENTAQGPVWNPESKNGNNAGGNLGPRLFFGLVQHVLIEGLPQYHSEAKKLLNEEVVLREPFQGNGLRTDGCLHQHNLAFTKQNPDGTNSLKILAQIYNNNYGKEFLKNAAALMWILDGTKFDLGKDVEEGIFASFFECQNWLFRGTTVEPSSVGRFIDSGNIITNFGGKSAVKKTLGFFQKVNRHQAETTSALHRYNNVVPSQEHALIGNRHFFVSDLMAHQRRSFMTSLRILSIRTCRPETIPDEGRPYFVGNSEGYYMGDGFLTLIVSGKELGKYKKEIFQVYDFARVSGVTIQYSENVPQVSTSKQKHAAHSYNGADFSGGVSNSMEGVAAMVYARPTVPLRAKKSWFFFDDVILCVGSGITLPVGSVTEHPVTTTLNQVVHIGMYWTGGKDQSDQQHIFGEKNMDKPVSKYPLSEGDWIHHDSVGYVPIIHSGSINVEVEARVSPKVTGPIYSFSLWLEHGPSPVNEKYAYALLPAQSVEQTKQFANSPSAKILSSDLAIHAACHVPSKTLGTVLFESGCIDINPCFDSTMDKVCTDQPILMIIKLLLPSSEHKLDCPNIVSLVAPNQEEGLPTSMIQISVSDPSQKLANVNLKFMKQQNEVHDENILLTKAPKLGASVVRCFEF